MVLELFMICHIELENGSLNDSIKKVMKLYMV